MLLTIFVALLFTVCLARHQTKAQLEGSDERGLILNRWRSRKYFTRAKSNSDKTIWRIGGSTIQYIMGDPDEIIVTNGQSKSALTVDFHNPLLKVSNGSARVRGHWVRELNVGESATFQAEGTFHITVCADYVDDTGEEPLDELMANYYQGIHGYPHDLLSHAKWCAVFYPWTLSFKSEEETLRIRYPEEVGKATYVVRTYDSRLKSARQDPIYAIMYSSGNTDGIHIRMKGPVMRLMTNSHYVAAALISNASGEPQVKFFTPTMDMTRMRKVETGDILIVAWRKDKARFEGGIMKIFDICYAEKKPTLLGLDEKWADDYDYVTFTFSNQIFNDDAFVSFIENFHFSENSMDFSFIEKGDQLIGSDGCTAKVSEDGAQPSDH